jgi:hypothetical protein
MAVFASFVLSLANSFGLPLLVLIPHPAVTDRINSPLFHISGHG